MQALKKLRFSRVVFLACAGFLAGCAAFTPRPRDYHIEHYLNADNSSERQAWRDARHIPDDALVAIFPDGSYKIVASVYRVIQLPSTFSPYVNQIEPCFLNMQGTYQALPVILQAICNRDPDRRPPFLFYY